MCRKFLFLFLIFAVCLCAKDNSVLYLTSEHDTLALVEGMVNAYNGQLVQIDQDVLIQGSDPLEMTRYYDGEHPFDSVFGYGVGGPYPIWLHCFIKPKMFDHIKNLRVHADLRMGSKLAFKLKEKKIDGEWCLEGKVPSSYFKNGYTNCCEALLRGEPSIYSTVVHLKNNEAVVTLADGTKRYYDFSADVMKGSYYRLKCEQKSNGNWRHYAYATDSKYKGRPIRIWTTNRDQTLTFNWIEFEYKGLDVYVRGSNGQETHYVMQIENGTYNSNGFLNSESGEYRKLRLKGASVDHRPFVEYDKVDNGHFKSTAFSTKKIRKSNGSYLRVKYDHHDDIQNLFISGIDQPLYTFSYYPNHTSVYDARGARTVFHFSKRRLTKLDQEYCLQKYKWDEKGQLSKHTLFDEGKLFCTRTYEYDDNGNILQYVLQGAITETGSNDSDVTSYQYSEWNKVLQKTRGNVQIHYSYDPCNHQIISQLTSVDNQIEEREFYAYDQNAILISKIVDDGSSKDLNNLENVTYRLITEIEPQLNPDLPGMTLPHIIKEFYQDPHTLDKQLLRKKERFYVGDLLAEEKVFDAHEVYHYSLHFEYNNRRELVRKTNALGEAILYGYDDEGNRIYKEKNGKKIYYTYDLSGRLVQEKEEDGTYSLLTSYTYDAMGNRTSITDPYGQTTQSVYDLSGREVEKIDPLGKTEQKKYNAMGLVTEFRDKEGYLTQTSYNLLGDPLNIHYPDGTSKKYTYNLQGDLVQEKHRDGTSTTYQVDYKGRIQKAQTFGADGALLKTLSYIYKGPHLITEIDAMGNAIHYSYDAAGRKISKTEAEIQTSYEYDALGRLFKTTLGNSVQIALYDFLDRIIEERTEDLLGNIYHKVQYAYDAGGNQTLKREFRGCELFDETHTVYNSQNLPILVIDALGFKTQFIYHRSDHLEKETIDPLGRQTFEIYNAVGNLQEVKLFDSSGSLLSQAYFFFDGRGNQILREDALILDGSCIGSYQVHTLYNSMNEKIQETEQDLKITKWSYKEDKLSTIQTPNGVVLFHTYDPFGRLQELRASDGTVHYRYSYDLNDNLLQAEDFVHHTLVERNYDTLNRIIYEKQATGEEVYFTYDPLGRVLEMRFCDGSIQYTYSPTALLSCKRYKDNNERYSYSQTTDWQGKISQAIFGNVPISYSYDALGRCKEIDASFYVQNLTYDAIGNLTQNRVKDGLGSYTAQFSYDGLNQLIQEEGPFNNLYQYDSLHNRRLHNEDPLAIDALNQVTQDALSAYNYDLNGRRISKGENSYAYDALGHLIAFNEVKYQYDALGRRIAEISPAQTINYLYSLETEIGAFINGKLFQFRTLYQGHLLGLEIDGKPYAPICNHRRDLCQLLDGESVAATYRYDAFGSHSHEGIDCPWLFSSGRYDANTELYHFDHREYDPKMGKWLIPDPLGFADGPNLYAYVHNNPLVYIDPTGLLSETNASREEHRKEQKDTDSIGHAFRRGFIDDATWGVTEMSLGPYESPNGYTTAAYYTGTAASLGVGLYFGSTEAKAAFYGTKFVCRLCTKSATKQATKKTMQTIEKKIASEALKHTAVDKAAQTTVQAASKKSLTRTEIKEYLANINKLSKEQIIKDVESVGLKLYGPKVERRFMDYVDKRGRIRFKIHPPGKKSTAYHHVHVYDRKGNSLSKDLQVVSKRSEDAHIPYGGNQ